MEPLATAQTRTNILTAMDWIGIPHAEPLVFSPDPLHNEDRSRVAMFDPGGLIRAFIESHPTEFTKDAGGNHNKHGWKVLASYRSTKHHGTPSLQLCLVEVKAAEGTTTPYDYMFLTDLDYANPFCNFPEHTWECLSNMWPGHTTDPDQVAKLLQKAIEETAPQ